MCSVVSQSRQRGFGKRVMQNKRVFTNSGTLCGGSVLEGNYFRFDLCAELNPWLEFVKGMALRIPLAGLIGIATTFGSEEEEFPPVAAIAKEFRPRADLNRPKSRPLVRPRWKIGEARFVLGREIGYGGALSANGWPGGDRDIFLRLDRMGVA